MLGPYRTAPETTEPPTKWETAPPKAHVATVTPDRTAFVIALMHARHPWLSVAGVALTSDGCGSIEARREHLTERLYLWGVTLGDVDKWVEGLWVALGVAYEPVAR